MKAVLQYGKSLHSCISPGKGEEGGPDIYGVSKGRTVSALPDSLRVIAAIKPPAAARCSLHLSSAASPRLALPARSEALFLLSGGTIFSWLNSFLGKVDLR